MALSALSPLLCVVYVCVWTLMEGISTRNSFDITSFVWILSLLLTGIQFEDVELTGLNVEIAWTYYIHNRCCLSKIFKSLHDNIVNLTILIEFNGFGWFWRSQKSSEEKKEGFIIIFGKYVKRARPCYSCFWHYRTTLLEVKISTSTSDWSGIADTASDIGYTTTLLEIKILFDISNLTWTSDWVGIMH